MRNLLKKSLLTSNKGGKSKLLAPWQDMVQEISAALTQAKRVLIGTHEHPDGDALGSSLAFYHALKAQGKEVTVYVPDPAADFYAFLPALDVITNTKPVDADSYDLILLLDYTQLYRTHLESEAKGHTMSICIDHHFSNPKEAKINLIVPEAAATAQIIYEFFKATDVKITPEVATCLLTGIFTDTGSFMHDSVTPDILDIASDLMNKGARLSHIAHETYQKKDLAGLKVWGRALSRIMTNETTGASVAVITLKDLEECGATLDDLSGVVNLLNTLPNTKYAMLLVEHKPGQIKGSLRSEPHKGVDVSVIARKLGGGGHKLASGFEIEGHIVKEGDAWRVISAKQIEIEK
ncbi:MAG: bifunctional oligoribonuclease/PAP phosphatase NrnA [Candidatus Andersenbacteria bacterium]|nr:bifunctional oligoribonuclease/PAP phosphatase NrnA [Candidatus Andersenbacteria bacterium]